MRAVRHHQFGPPERVLRCEAVDAPPPGPGAVLVRLAARPINPSDLLGVAGEYGPEIALPAVPGFEGVGTVAAIGPDTAAPPPGTRVLALRGGGTWAEYVAVPAEYLVAVPDAIADELACQLYINPLTAWFMLTRAVAARPGDVILANAGGSAFCRALAQFCRHRGVQLVAVTRSPAYDEALRALGAEVVNESREDVAAAVARLARGPVVAAFDAVGGASGSALARCLPPGGTMLYYARLSRQALDLTEAEIAARGIKIAGYWLRQWVNRATPAEWHAAFAELMAVAVRIGLVMPVAARFDLSDIAAAARAAQAPGRDGKVLLVG
ncbi:MAG TPA: zinc-dependent alcohol dehydrogenase family protein [Alphaproteobacteria bacterium]|nr:zinc-dependent alcohol dehydrogenase family protein [Alphaproteobacteria bacterium]